MTYLYDDPKSFAADALLGFSRAYSRFVRQAPGGVLRATPTPEGKVALVIGGGSGHYPAFAGYVGAGLADAAVAGRHFRVAFDTRHCENRAAWPIAAGASCSALATMPATSSILARRRAV